MCSPSRALCASAIAIAVASSAAFAISVDNVAPAALAQPQINFIVRTSPAGTPLIASTPDFDPYDPGPDVNYHNIDAYFDTGASGISLNANTCAAFGITAATSPNPVYLGQPILFGDVGAAGTTSSYVSSPIYLSLASYTPAANTTALGNYSAYTQNLPAMRVAFGPVESPSVDPIDQYIASYNAVDVVGMPAMAGKIVVLDVRKVDTFDFETAFLAVLANMFDPTYPVPDYDIHTHVYTAGDPNNPAFSPNADSPGIPVTNRHIKLSYGSFDRFTTLANADPNEGPALTHNPFIGADPVAVFDGLINATADNSIKLTMDGKPTITGNFLFDTGAAASMISTAKAAQLGITVTYTTEPNPDPFGDGEDISVPHVFRDGVELLGDDTFSLSLAGAGGATITLGGFYLDSLLLHTTEGDLLNDEDPLHIRFRRAPLLIHDISMEDPANPGHFLTLDGIFGMNYLVASATVASDLSGFGDTVVSPFDWVTFDEPNGILGLNIKQEFLDAVPEPASLSLLALGLPFLLRRPRRPHS